MRYLSFLILSLVLFAACGGNGPSDVIEDTSVEEVPAPAIDEPVVVDTDQDIIPDSIDNCPGAANSDQLDTDSDGVGDICDEPAPVEEIVIPPKDSDNDGVIDLIDNCVAASNPDQLDTDKDGIGDICDEDIDGDGTVNNKDNCPMIPNSYQDNADNDLTGDICDPDIDGDGLPNDKDNCPYTANSKQLPLDDDSDGVFVECDLDDTDPFARDDQTAVFVDIAHGSDSSDGKRQRPFASIDKAITVAEISKLPIYIAAGLYDVSSTILYDGLQLIGGFENGDDIKTRFSSRMTTSELAQYRTELISDTTATTLFITNRNVTIDGFYITNTARPSDEPYSSATVQILGEGITLTRNHIIGNATTAYTMAIYSKNAKLNLDRNMINGNGRYHRQSSTHGAVFGGGSAQLTNNIILSGNGHHSTAVNIEGTNIIATNNTIVAASGNPSYGYSRGIIVDTEHILFINNLVLTHNAYDQYTLVCAGVPPDENSSILNNVFAAVTANTDMASIEDCFGTGFTEPPDAIGNAVTASNVLLYAPLKSDLTDDEYHSGAYVTFHTGIDTNIESYGLVMTDYYGTKRNIGSYTIGAVEAEQWQDRQ